MRTFGKKRSTVYSPSAGVINEDDTRVGSQINITNTPSDNPHLEGFDLYKYVNGQWVCLTYGDASSQGSHWVIRSENSWSTYAWGASNVWIGVRFPDSGPQRFLFVERSTGKGIEFTATRGQDIAARSWATATVIRNRPVSCIEQGATFPFQIEGLPLHVSVSINNQTVEGEYDSDGIFVVEGIPAGRLTVVLTDPAGGTQSYQARLDSTFTPIRAGAHFSTVRLSNAGEGSLAINGREISPSLYTQEENDKIIALKNGRYNVTVGLQNGRTATKAITVVANTQNDFDFRGILPNASSRDNARTATGNGAVVVTGLRVGSEIIAKKLGPNRIEKKAKVTGESTKISNLSPGNYDLTVSFRGEEQEDKLREIIIEPGADTVVEYEPDLIIGSLRINGLDTDDEVEIESGSFSRVLTAEEDYVLFEDLEVAKYTVKVIRNGE